MFGVFADAFEKEGEGDMRNARPLARQLSCRLAGHKTVQCLNVPDTVALHRAGKKYTIKSAAVKALDKEYNGLITEFVELNEFAGKPVSLS